MATSRFLTRVELHGVKDGEISYPLLHVWMVVSGFKRTIPTASGLRKLPPAEYYYEGRLSAEQVCNKAKKAADMTGKKSSIIVAQMVTYYTYDLPLVTTKK